MPKKAKDPLHAVLDYFETAPLEEAEKALGLVGRAVKARRPAALVKSKMRTARSRKPQDRPLPMAAGDPALAHHG